MLKVVGLSLAIFVVVYFVIAFGLIISQRPTFTASTGDGGIDFGSAMAADYSDLPTPLTYTARDGTALPYRLYPSQGDADRIIILVHGSAWHGMQFHPMAKRLAADGLGMIVVPDMRGHGAHPARRGDVDYIAQLEDDMADLIDHLHASRAGAPIVLGGHSSGGGFVLRFAGGARGAKADAFILLAPFLKYNAPTTRQNAGGWALPALRRIIGLSMLNTVGITARNGLPIISFAMPKAVMDGPYGDTATVIYSYRMNAAFSPHDDYESDLAALKQPFLLGAGDADESFYAERYEPVMSAQTASGTYRVLPGLTHMGVVTDPAAIDAIETWLRGLKTTR